MHRQPFNSAIAAHLFAAEEWRQTAMTNARQAQLIRETGIDTDTGMTHLSAVRHILGAALVRVGERLYGVPRSALRQHGQVISSRTELA